MAGHITIITFGYKFGKPEGEFAHVADVRNIPATAGGTKDQTGLMKEIHDKVMATSAAKAWLNKMKKWSLKDGDRVAIGCARGHHRSVAVAKDYASWLRSQGWDVTVQNRDINKDYQLTIADVLEDIKFAKS